MNPNDDAISSATTKTIYLIRHGVAEHNVPDPQTGERPNLFDPNNIDPPLIRQGEVQASDLGEQLRKRGLVATNADNEMDVEGANNAHNKTIELVVSSPLTRCLQTASHIFPSYYFKSDEISLKTSSSSPFLLNKSCTTCCHGDVREAYGMHYPDKRSPLSQLISTFPAVTYHPSLTEHDTEWRADYRETGQDVSQRVHNFFAWLMQQPHNNIAVVTHGVWLECAILKYCPDVLDHGKKRVYNCDVYCGKLMGSSSSPVLCDVEQISFNHA